MIRMYVVLLCCVPLVGCGGAVTDDDDAADGEERAESPDAFEQPDEVVPVDEAAGADTVSVPDDAAVPDEATMADEVAEPDGTGSGDTPDAEEEAETFTYPDWLCMDCGYGASYHPEDCHAHGGLCEPCYNCTSTYCLPQPPCWPGWIQIYNPPSSYRGEPGWYCIAGIDWKCGMELPPI